MSLKTRVVTHDPSLANQAERVIELKDGRIISDYYTAHANDKATKSAQKMSHFSTKSSLLAWFDRLKEAFKMSIYAMKAHKMRTLLTMLGIIIGIASVVSIVGLGQGSQAKILADINALGTNTITVMDGYPFGDPRRRFGRDNLTVADAEAVASQPYAKSVSPQVDKSLSIRYQNIDVTGTINGVLS